jgi:hypothetical protein
MPWEPPAEAFTGWRPPDAAFLKQAAPADVAKIMREKYPQAFKNPNAPQSMGELLKQTFSTEHPLDTAASFVKGALWDTAAGIGGALRHPIDTAYAMAKAQQDELYKTIQTAHDGNYMEAGGHALASLMPVVGPIAANIGAEIGEGKDVARNVGRATALAASVSPENVQAPAIRAVKTAAPYVKAAAKGAMKGATSTEAEVGAAALGYLGKELAGTKGAAIGAAAGAAPATVRGAIQEVRNLVADKRAAAMKAANPEPQVLPPPPPTPPAPMPAPQPFADLPGPSGTFMNVPQPPQPSILDVKRQAAVRPVAQPEAAPPAQFDPRSLPPDPIRSQPWYSDAVAAMKARRVGAPEAVAPQALNPAVADESQVGLIRQMAQERTPNALADAFRNIAPEQRREVIKAFDRDVITAAQDAVRKNLEAQGVTDPATIEAALQAAKPDFSETVPTRIAAARATKAESLFNVAREAGITPAKMAKLSPAKWEELAIKAGVRKPTWTANGSETVREVIQMANEWEAKNGPIQPPAKVPKPMKQPSTFPPTALDTPEKLAAAQALMEALNSEK